VTWLDENSLKSDVLSRAMSRRAVIKRSMAIGLAAPVAVSLLAACGGDDPTATPAAQAPANTPAAPAAGNTPAAAENTPAAAENTPAAAENTPAAAAPTQAPSGEPATYGGTLVKLEANDFVTMFPAFTTGPTLDSAYDNIVKWRWDGASWEFVPWLAESWELEENTAIFNIREGVQFHDGTDLDAEAIAWNANIWMTHAQSIALNALEGLDPENPAEVVDTHVVQINLLAPKGSILSQLSDLQRTTGIYSPAAYERLGDEGVAREAVGSGPFVFVEWQTGAQVITRRNENYWATDESGNQLPFLDGVNYRWVSDDSVRLIEMRSGNAHFSTFIRGRDVATVRNDPNLQYIENPESGGTLYRIFFNARQGPFAEDLDLRKAVLYAINRDAIAQAVGGGIGFAATYDLLPGAVGYDDTIPHYEYNMDLAREHRAQAQAQGTVNARLTIISREADQQMAQMIQQMLQEIDVNIEVEVLERVAWGDQVRRNNDFEIATQRTNSPPDPDQHWTLTWDKDGVASYSRMDEPEVQDAIERGRATYDPEERAAIYREAQVGMFETAWWGNIWVQPNNYLLSARVKNVPMIYGEWTREEVLQLEQ
jgi:peptide/nickel transport system substrate-binding protein